jgi:peptide deformylase
MIGVNKCIIVFSAGPMVLPMLNPFITKREGPYEAEEGACLWTECGKRRVISLSR